MQVMIRFLTAILLIGRCVVDILGLEYVGLGYYIEVDTEERILMHRPEAYDMGHDPVPDRNLADQTVCYRHSRLGIYQPCLRH